MLTSIVQLQMNFYVLLTNVLINDPLAYVLSFLVQNILLYKYGYFFYFFTI